MFYWLTCRSPPKMLNICVACTHTHCFTSYLGYFHLVKPMYLNTPGHIWKGSDGDEILLLSLTPRETFCPFRMKQPWTLRMKSPASPGLLSVVKHRGTGLGQCAHHALAYFSSFPLPTSCLACYFSHTWCLYCKAFCPPQLVTIYTNLQLESKDLTIFIVWTNLMASVYSLVL